MFATFKNGVFETLQKFLGWSVFFLRKKLDFLPNKLSKYSIRRFSVGTASILVGATLLFGIGNEADAAENTHTQSTSEEVTDNNTASVASTTEETTNNEVTNEKASRRGNK